MILQSSSEEGKAATEARLRFDLERYLNLDVACTFRAKINKFAPIIKKLS